MIKEETRQLGHAFFDGKTIQYFYNGEWKDWPLEHCPSFDSDRIWRIKPDEPKTITICTFMSEYGRIRQAVKSLGEYVDLEDDRCWTHIKSLDQIVEVA